jgi:hypothetical protein
VTDTDERQVRSRIGRARTGLPDVRQAEPSTRAARLKALSAVTGVLAVLLFGAGCAVQRPAPGMAVSGCLRVSIAALRQHASLKSMPAACSKLGKAQLTSVVDAAVAATAKQERGKLLMRARLRTLHPLLPYLRPDTGTGPVPLQPTAAGQGTDLPRGLTALAAWLVTVALGTSMGRWIFRGGLRGIRGRTGRKALMNVTHLGLALAGLATWIGYVVTGVGWLSWAGCVFLLPVTGLGMSLLLLRLPVRAPTAMAAVATIMPGSPAVLTVPAGPSRDARGPSAVTVAVHVTCAVVTMLVALLAAIGNG